MAADARVEAFRSLIRTCGWGPRWKRFTSPALVTACLETHRIASAGSAANFRNRARLVVKLEMA